MSDVIVIFFKKPFSCAALVTFLHHLFPMLLRVQRRVLSSYPLLEIVETGGRMDHQEPLVLLDSPAMLDSRDHEDIGSAIVPHAVHLLTVGCLEWKMADGQLL